MEVVYRSEISRRTKPFDLKLHFVKQRASEDNFNIEYVSTDKNLAEILL